MKAKIAFLTAILLSSQIIWGQSDNSISVTVYNSNLGVVKEVREVDLQKGTSNIKITDVAQLIDPTSVHIKIDGEVLEQNYQYDLVNMYKILQKYVDKNIQLIGETGELIEGTLLSASSGNVVIAKNDGGLIMLPNLDKFRFSVTALPEGLITKPTLIWKVDSNSSGKQNVEVSYQTGGMNWHAEYVALLNENDTKMDLNSWVSIENNSGKTFKDAKLKLVAGDVNLVKNQPKYGRTDVMYEAVALKSAADGFQEKEFFEYHIYDLQRPSTIADKEIKQISLFEAENVNIHKKYLYKSGQYYSDNGKVAVYVEFKNDEKSNLGVPMPKGKVRVYKSDGTSVEFIGEDLIDHTPKNEELNLKIGDAFDVVAEEIQSDYKKISNKVHEEEYEITLKNHKKDDITVEVARDLGVNWEILSSSIKCEKESSSKITFQVPIKADDETVLKFRVRYSY